MRWVAGLQEVEPEEGGSTLTVVVVGIRRDAGLCRAFASSRGRGLTADVTRHREDHAQFTQLVLLLGLLPPQRHLRQVRSRQGRVQEGLTGRKTAGRSPQAKHRAESTQKCSKEADCIIFNVYDYFF